MPPRFSIIIPAYNEERFLPRLLASIEIARANYDHEEVEVIVADNSSTDRTAEIARSKGCRVASISERRIAAARNGGANIARGEILCFIDADSAIHAHTFEKIDRILSDNSFIGGTTGVYLERKSFPILLCYWILMAFVWLTGIDTGVVFCRREDFWGVGGYDENLLYAEDVSFLLALKRRGRRRGQRLAHATSIKALGSTRKFDDFGDWHYFWLPFSFAAAGIFSNQDKRRRFADYWYQPHR